MASARDAGGPPLCETCARSAPRCAACHQPILGVFYTFEELLPAAAQRQFCAACVQRRPRCDLCAAPVPNGAAPLAGGQWRCALCALDVVSDLAEVRALFAQATAALVGLVGAPLRETPRLEVVSRREMGEVRGRYERSARDAKPETAGHHVLGYCVHRGGSSTIYVEQALPRTMLLGTLAHELGHAWQAERNPDLREPLLSEGFAEWVAHRVLVSAGYQTAAARATRRDDIYGRGLRHFLDLERDHGRAAVLAAILGRTM